jgi:hypothetical protein
MAGVYVDAFIRLGPCNRNDRHRVTVKRYFDEIFGEESARRQLIAPFGQGWKRLR